jgi:putative ABC transport system permease protein
LGLVLLLEGLSAGVDARLGTLQDHAGADLYVAQPGTTSLLGATSYLPPGTAGAVAQLPGVRSATPMRGFFTVALAGEARVPAYLVGAPTGAPGSPWRLARGRAPTAVGEVAIAQHAAARAGVDVGDVVEVMGTPLEVVGLAADADLFMASFAFVTHETTNALLGAPGSTSFVLVRADDPAAVAAAARRAGLHVRTPEQLLAADLALKSGAYDAALRGLIALASLVGGVVVSLTIYAGVLDQARAYGVARALGMGRVQLARIVMSQSLTVAGLGACVGGAVFLAAGAVVTVARPELAIVATTGGVVRTAVAAVAIGLLAGLLPARRIMHVPPASAFGGAR